MQENKIALSNFSQSCPSCEEKHILIFKKCYDQRFLNFADRIAQKAIAFFSLFYEENKLLHSFPKGRPPSADLRYGAEDSISPSTFFFLS